MPRRQYWAGDENLVKQKKLTFQRHTGQAGWVVACDGGGTTETRLNP
jgi:hypothetical protein